KKICSRFHLVANQLKTRHSNRESLVISDEYDVQDLLHALLHIYFDDIRPEEWTPNYAGGSSRVDFLLKNEVIIIEVKKTRATLKAKD
ncbi:PD-(D/E)XK nuclease domain-containing protein, partial [Klebsiella pneumoniae]|uniref:PD-(D/E)XK nuclease domain-containing protein n=1 Tax=Klebsiella pneumoniae TaxID=573 RepID=UPI00405354D4